MSAIIACQCVHCCASTCWDLGDEVSGEAPELLRILRILVLRILRILRILDTGYWI